jgi:hypothetical protein
MIFPVALPSTLWARALATSSAGRPEHGSIFPATLQRGRSLWPGVGRLIAAEPVTRLTYRH